MSAGKNLLKAGVAAGAAVLGAGALVYECALNTKLNGFFVGLFDRRNGDAPAEDAAGNAPAEDPVAEARRWFDEHVADDRVITTPATGRIHAYFIPAEAPSHKWAVLCHGYNSEPRSTGPFARHYHALGYNCLSPSLRGWGNDETNYCTMGYHDKDLCMAWIDYIVALDPEAEIVLHGYSMGAVTIMLCTGETLPPQVKAAVEDCGFSTCWDQFAAVIKHYAKLPAFPLLHAVNAVSILRGNFDIRKNQPLEAVKRSVTPTVFLHGTADDFISIDMMDLLYEACAAPKVKQPIEGGIHARAVYKDPEVYWAAVDGFLKDKITA